jgi:oligoendopeptidase F
LLVEQDRSDDRQQQERTEMKYRQEYETIKQAASRERTRINELHENNLDKLLDDAKQDTSRKLTAAWNEKPPQVR